MNKLLFAVSAAVCLSTINVASAQLGNAGAANPAIGAEIKHDQATSTTGDTSGSKIESSKETMHKGTTHRHAMHKHKARMEAMDTNKDGKISKEEFMAFHEAKYDAMKKNKDGSVDIKDMRMMHHHHHHHHHQAK